MRSIACFTLLLSVAACATPAPADPPFTCQLEALDGTWRLTLTEQNPTSTSCGPLDPQTAVFSSGKTTSSTKCTDNSRKVSADGCRIDFDYVCETPDGTGTARYVGITKQVSADKLQSDETITLTDPGLDCQGTYSVDWSRL